MGNILSMKTGMVLVLIIYFSSCVKPENFTKTIKIDNAFYKGNVVVEKIEKLNKYKISIFNTLTGKGDRIFTPYEIFQMNIGDVNHDGKVDICIGIIKPTPFDPILKKRLFIFQIDRDYIRPLWLSSRLVKPLEEFIVCYQNNKYTIKTIEKMNNYLFCINEYRWESFGMSYFKKHCDSLTFCKALLLLNNHNQ